MASNSALNLHANSWMAAGLESRTIDDKGGHAVFARQAFKTGDLLAMWGGTVVTGAELAGLADSLRSLTIQVDDDLYLVSTRVGPADHFNHSCDPNAGLYGQIGLVAMRDIAVGDEVCFDYAMSDSTAYDEFPCSCETTHCRQQITAEDWRMPTLWERYDGYFSLYLQRRIDMLRQQSSP